MQSPFPKLASFARRNFYASTLVGIEQQGFIAQASCVYLEPVLLRREPS